MIKSGRQVLSQGRQQEQEKELRRVELPQFMLSQLGNLVALLSG